jgi:DNA-binding NtrC family response regulator
VRIVSATNLIEQRLFDPGVFRPDLLFRLNTIVIRVPPLRERKDDVPGLLHHYLSLYETQYRRPVRELAPSALERLCDWPWPGNVRALRHACERAVILAAQDEYRYEDFGLAMPAPAAVDTPARAVPNAAVMDGADGEFRLGALERETIAAALDKAKGNISLAARMLGLSRAALYRTLGKHGI